MWGCFVRSRVISEILSGTAQLQLESPILLPQSICTRSRSSSLCALGVIVTCTMNLETPILVPLEEPLLG
ncbi:hypothetical protein K7X08_008259 [Anisodus acutangulus]|uniref:Uncharacterized protein n=1 Tax=Anisodus acutangulus TaxID=402998 RepID=A0A9Q1MQS3_9SOLA|nr:hypothetical protein K7X08_008259 [Anisodus acutangulus]